MPHKITLTGSATGPLREYDRYVAFDMREKDLPFAPFENALEKLKAITIRLIIIIDLWLFFLIEQKNNDIT